MYDKYYIEISFGTRKQLYKCYEEYHYKETAHGQAPNFFYGIS